jgi:hypothetical protein
VIYKHEETIVTSLVGILNLRTIQNLCRQVKPKLKWSSTKAKHVTDIKLLPSLLATYGTKLLQTIGEKSRSSLIQQENDWY